MNFSLKRLQSAFSQQSDRDAMRSRQARIKKIADGAFPSAYELYACYPPCRKDWRLDVRLWAENELLKPKLTPAVRRQLQAVAEHQTRFKIAAIDGKKLDHQAQLRIDWYLAILGEPAARGRVLLFCLQMNDDEWIDRICTLAFGLSLPSLPESADEETPVSDYTLYGDPVRGMQVMRHFDSERFNAAVIAADTPDDPHPELEDGFLDQLSAIDEQESTAQKSSEPASLTVAAVPTGPSAMVVPTLNGGVGSKERKAVREAFNKIAGKALPLITRGNLFGHRSVLVARSPHLSGVIDTILADLSTRDAVRIRPTILVGEAGAGKTDLARSICRQLGLPSTVYAAGGVADGTFGGTAAHWSTSGPSTPLALVRDTGVANPCVIVDEIDKASSDNRNGRLFDVLLGFLDRGNAKEFRDPSLEVSVDLSHISWILTANAVDDLPAPLRDRCRIVSVPNPEWRHVGDIVKSIVKEIADEREIDQRWIEPLAGDELDLLKKTWAGGSIRKLRRIVETIVDGRDGFMARA